MGLIGTRSSCWLARCGRGASPMRACTMPRPARFGCMALASPQDQIYAAVCQHPVFGVHLELTTNYQDGTICTYSTGKQAGLLDQPQFKIAKSLPELARRRTARPIPGPAAKAGDAAGHERGLSRSLRVELGPRARLANRPRRRDGSRNSARGRAGRRRDFRGRHADHPVLWRHSINDFYREHLQESWLAAGKTSAGEWERIRSRVQFVHDKLEWEDVMALCGLSGDDGDRTTRQAEQIAPEAERIAAAFPPRTAFARINELLPAERRWQKIGEVSEPIAADLYLLSEIGPAAALSRPGRRLTAQILGRQQIALR